jgi:hypothetical protein
MKSLLREYLVTLGVVVLVTDTLRLFGKEIVFEIRNIEEEEDK